MLIIPYTLWVEYINRLLGALAELLLVLPLFYLLLLEIEN
jgi:heme A synthase